MTTRSSRFTLPRHARTSVDPASAWRGWEVGLALLVAAWFAVDITPPLDRGAEPFAVTGEIGEVLEGRNIAARVVSVSVADRVVDEGGWWAEGTWVVVEAELTATTTEEMAVLSTANLVVDGRTYRASERPESARDAILSVGIPVTGSLAFEIPEDLAEGEAVLQLAPAVSPVRDSQLEVRIDLATIPRSSEVTVWPATWANP